AAREPPSRIVSTSSKDFTVRAIMRFGNKRDETADGEPLLHFQKGCDLRWFGEAQPTAENDRPWHDPKSRARIKRRCRIAEIVQRLRAYFLKFILRECQFILPLFSLQRLVSDLLKQRVTSLPFCTVGGHHRKPAKGVAIFARALEHRQHLKHGGNDVGRV